MKKIIAAQQSYAKVNGITEVCTLEEIAETALSISEGVLRNSNIEVVRDYEKLPAVLVDRHQIMQILVNLISNAKHALEEAAEASSASSRWRLRRSKAACASRCVTTASAYRARISRRSSITASRPRRQGHGFGLHNCANAAQQMDGSLTAYSDGRGLGASFVLRMPVEYADEIPHGRLR